MRAPTPPRRSRRDHRSRRSVPTGIAAVAVTACLLLAGCGGTGHSTEHSAGSAPSTSAAPPSSAAPSVPAGTPTSSAASAAASPLLTRTDLVTSTGGLPWRLRATHDPDDAALFGPCARFGATTLGASDRRARAFGSPGTHSTITQVVATFPDAVNTRRAATVLHAWQTRCAFDATARGLHPVTVGQPRDVAVPSGSGRWYVVTLAGRAGGSATSQQYVGEAVAGQEIAVLVITTPVPGPATLTQPSTVAALVKLVASRLPATPSS